MENHKAARSGFLISLLFYVCYFFYFGLYSFEIMYIFPSKMDYFMLCFLLITTILSISLPSIGLMYTSFFLVIVVSLVEINQYKNSSFASVMDDEFIKVFLIVRLFSTVNFLLFYYLYINNLKRKERVDLAKSKSSEKKTQTQTVHEKTSREYKNGDLRHGGILPVGGKSIQEVVTHKQDNEDASKKTQVIEGYILKHVTIPIMEKDERSPPPALSSQQNKMFEALPHHLPYSHYSVKNVDNVAHGLGANQPMGGATYVDDNLDETYRRQYTSPWIVPKNNSSLYGNDVPFAGAESQHLNRASYVNSTTNTCYNGVVNPYPANRLPDDRDSYQFRPHQMGAYQSGGYPSGAYQAGA
ncbi:conserved Plasmodium protein, unknown function [Plasmodium knowlesi strain H]|uniref:Uncharacterized protein n=3 Tax=Plasmodium knowlesi TaxID=5850 RepID=A0A5K1UVH2_PLAKH|nr:conserved Plasmodium protein, unknown function [Plasmodium knowlesi strain H]OTN67553.1 Uncharacterized protein PKNOH_S06424700 [Plasmodium knowlesi]CAA9987520.1 conserved Plasmodium protein, unknown function [Plasmodium knowlesi strain H]SBO23136.1 conserved Plasmodium protein, unknown function [Plasmodium knowlesi strain H]SBO23786.1 conserved Plasmodium protein, unknown function [Plasmodium knowlesi strain H]VVS76994.1 conserved Plasmodium protein, unknown function [Plasmodium knowlesi s|eukprot:XP_002258521.1 hypothetical protein, conserved in Plasmodium species [Plasmodium knowlesi strain H]